MKRLWFLPLVVSALAALAVADEPATLPVNQERIRQLERNQGLLQKLIQGGVDLAKAQDHLKRASYCNDMVKTFADEIKLAAKDHDSDRAVELGQHLHQLLERGVAGNLNRVGPSVPSSSMRWKNREQVRHRATRTVDDLEETLQKAADGDPENMKEALETVQKGQAALAEVIQVKDEK